MDIRRNLQRYISLYNYISAYKTGFDSLELEDAVSNKLESLNLYGKCIEKILLPKNYTEVEYITNNTNTFIDTGIITDLDNMELEIKVKPTLGPWYILQNFDGNINGFNGNKDNDISFELKTSSPELIFNFDMKREDSKVYTLHSKNRNGIWSGWIRNDTDNLLEIKKPVLYKSFIPNDLPLLIFGNQKNFTSAGNSVYYIKIYKANRLVCYLIPAIDNKKQGGFYDIIQNRFLTPNKGSVKIGPVKKSWESTPDMPINIVCNGGAIINNSKNLFNLTPGNIKLGHFINDKGEEITSSSNYLYDTYIPIQSNTSYVFFGRRKSDNTLSKYNRISWYNDKFEWISNSEYEQNTTTIAISPKNAAYSKLSCNIFGNNINLRYDDLVNFNWMFYSGEKEESFVPNGIITNDGKESLFLIGKNLFNRSEALSGYIDEKGKEISSLEFIHSNLIPVETNCYYTFSGIRMTNDGNKRIHGYNSDGKWVKQLGLDPSSTAVVGGYYITVEIPSNISYVVISGMRIGDNGDEQVQLEKSIRPTRYENYNKQKISIPPLLSIDDKIKDTVDLSSGILNHNVGVKILTGTEKWIMEKDVFYIEDNTIPEILLPNNGIMCTHFMGNIPSSVEISDMRDLSIKWGSSKEENRLYIKYNRYDNVSDFEQWLSSEYEAGIPVIITYPIKMEIQENIGKNGIMLTTGTNHIERLGSINGLEINATYKKLH